MEQQRTSGRAGRVIMVVTALGLAAWIAVRMAEAAKTQAALAAEREETARRAASRDDDAPLELIQASAERWKPQVPVEGTLSPLREVDLGFKAGGRLSQIRVRAGEAVRLGQTLGQLEALEAEAQVAAAEAQVRAAEAQLVLAEDNATRMGKMAEKGAVADMSGVQARAQRALAQAQVDAAKAQRALAGANLANHGLSAPFPGFVTRAPTAPGAIVGPGLPLFHLVDNSSLRLVGTIGEQDGALVLLGATVEVELDGRPLSGKVTALLPSLDPGTRRVPFEAELPIAGAGPIRAGGFVRGVILGGEERAVLRLPQSVLVPGSQDRIVVLQKGRLRLRRVRFVPAEDRALRILEGLAAEEEVVKAPVPEARDDVPLPEKVMRPGRGP